MFETCVIQKGGLKLQKQTAKKYFMHKILLYGHRIFLYCMALIISYMVTKYVFSTCIIPEELNNTVIIPLSDCISLGSIFATFGSAVIAVLSLTSSSLLSGFEQKLSVLKNQFSEYETSKWIRWEFLPRQSRQRASDGQYQYYKLDNATLCFDLGIDNLSLPIPTVHKDFYDLPIFSVWWKMGRCRSIYRAHIHKKHCIADFLAWDCLFSMYSNIILYRISQFVVWIGATFVINSIVFAFSYH